MQVQQVKPVFNYLNDTGKCPRLLSPCKGCLSWTDVGLMHVFLLKLYSYSRDGDLHHQS